MYAGELEVVCLIYDTSIMRPGKEVAHRLLQRANKGCIGMKELIENVMTGEGGRYVQGRAHLVCMGIF